MEKEENKKPSNPNAFPTMEHGSDRTGRPTVFTHEGMTLRDYFAAKAMQAYISTYIDQTSAEQIKGHSEYISDMAYTIADTMLKQREL